MRTLLAVALLVVALPLSTKAATIYLMDRSRLENVKILEETPTEFRVRKADTNYSLVYKYDSVRKQDIFSVVGDAGELLYPPILRPLALSPGDSATVALTPGQIQALMLGQQEETNAHMGHLAAAATIAALAAIAIAAGVWYGATK
jgi:hypothetical protein